jgi:hypothetical protein
LDVVEFLDVAKAIGFPAAEAITQLMQMSEEDVHRGSGSAGRDSHG